MKIAYLMQTGVPDIRHRPLSGAANHFLNVFQGLRNLGHVVCLLAYLDGQIWKSYDLKTYEPVRLPHLDSMPFRCVESCIRRLQYEFQLPYGAFFESARFVVACVQELSQFDLFYERMGWMGCGGGLAARLTGIPLVLEVNGDHLTEMESLGIAPEGIQRWLSIKITNSACHRAKAIVATGEGWKQRFVENWKTDPHRVAVVENGSEFVELLSRDQLRAFSSSFDKNAPIKIIYIGSLEPWNGIEILLCAMLRMISKNVKFQLNIVGAGSEKFRVESLIRELDLSSWVTLTGQLDTKRLSAHLAQADIGVAPYCGRFEYSGLKLIDYKAAGLVAIASGEDGHPNVLKHGESGWIVPPCDEVALSDAIIHLAMDPTLRAEIGKKARIQAEQLHSWRQTVKELTNIFDNVVRGR